MCLALSCCLGIEKYLGAADGGGWDGLWECYGWRKLDAEYAEGVSIVIGVGYLLDLLSSSIEGVDCHNTIILIREETRCVVHINHSASAENLGGWRSVDCYLLVLPRIEVF